MADPGSHPSKIPTGTRENPYEALSEEEQTGISGMKETTEPSSQQNPIHASHAYNPPGSGTWRGTSDSSDVPWHSSEEDWEREGMGTRGSGGRK